MAEQGRRSDRSLALFLAAIFFVLAAPVYWMGAELPEERPIARGYENAGLYNRVYPAFHYAAERFRAGQLPVWNPKVLCGTPFLADPSHGVFQPLNAVFLFLPTERAMAVHAFAGLFLMGLFTTAFALSLGLRLLPSLFGGAVFAFCGASASAMSRPELMGTLAWAPLAFCALRASVSWGTAARVLMLGTALALAFLAGSLALFVAMGVLLLGYAVLQTAFAGERGERRRLAVGCVLAAVFALLLSAVQWLPSLTWVWRLEEPHAALWRLPTAGHLPNGLGEALVQVFHAAPEILPPMAYVGALPLALFPAAFFGRRGRLEACYFTGAAGLLFVVAVAAPSLFPSAWPFQALVYPAVFSMAVVAALGLDRLLTTGRDPRSPRVWAPLLLVAAWSAGLCYVCSASGRGVLLIMAGALVPFAILRFKWVARISGAVLVLVLFADLYRATVNYYQHPFRDAAEAVPLREELVRAAENQAMGDRVMICAHPLNGAWLTNLGMVSSLREAGGGHAALTREEAKWWGHLGVDSEVPPDAAQRSLHRAAERPGLVNFMAARALLISGESSMSGPPPGWEDPRLRSLRRVSGVDLILNESALPRLHWRPGWQAVSGVDAAVAALSDPAFDRMRYCVVQAKGEALSQLVAVVPSPAGKEAPIDWESVGTTVIEDEPERVEVRVVTPSPGVTVLADTLAPGWRARLDGNRVPILQVNGLYRGVATPAGEHRIVFEYRPMSLFAGVVVSIGGTAFLVLWLWLRSPKTARDAPPRSAE